MGSFTGKEGVCWIGDVQCNFTQGKPLEMKREKRQVPECCPKCQVPLEPFGTGIHKGETRYRCVICGKSFAYVPPIEIEEPQCTCPPLSVSHEPHCLKGLWERLNQTKEDQAFHIQQEAFEHLRSHFKGGKVQFDPEFVQQMEDFAWSPSKPNCPICTMINRTVVLDPVQGKGTLHRCVSCGSQFNVLDGRVTEQTRKAQTNQKAGEGTWSSRIDPNYDPYEDMRKARERMRDVGFAFGGMGFGDFFGAYTQANNRVFITCECCGTRF